MSSSPHRHPMSTQTLILSHFANFKLAGDRVVRDAVHSIQSAPSVRHARPARPARPARRRRARRYKHASSRRVNAMSDADLEAELAARRAARARERERYARAMRSEKLAVLESELLRLRSEISRMDRSTPLGGGTPPTARWEALPHERRSARNARPKQGAYPSSSPLGSPPLTSAVPPAAMSARSAPGAPPLPPPPPPELPALDPEKQKREKLERQRRREAKRKEREAAKKPVTLADIIRSAGPNPASRLKPSGSTPLPDVNEPEEDEKAAFANLKDTLKKTASAEGSNDKTSESDPDKKTDETKDDSKSSEDKDTKKADDQSAPLPAPKTPQSDERDAAKQDEPKEPASATKKLETATKPDVQSSSDKDIQKNDSVTESVDKSESQEDASARKPKSAQASEGPDRPPSASATTSLPNGTQSHANGPPPVDSTVDQSSSKTLEDTNDAVSALSALTAKLPKKSSPTTSSNDTKPGASAPSSRRLSLEEKRRLRRAAKESTAAKED